MGAVRHKGFIPWDDDMDFFMLIEDYIKFIDVTKTEKLEEPYGFFTSFSLARIRRKDTTGCTESEMKMAVPPCNLGVFIDIFPLCNIPESQLGRFVQKNLFKLYRIANDGYGIERRKRYDHTLKVSDYLDKRIVLWHLFSIFINRDKFLQNLYKLLAWRGPTDRVGLTSFRPYDKKYMWKRSLFDRIIEKPFENKIIPIPEEYDTILKNQFGDYMQFVKGGALHTIPVLDLDTPYSQKLKELFDQEK